MRLNSLYYQFKTNTSIYLYLVIICTMHRTIRKQGVYRVRQLLLGRDRGQGKTSKAHFTCCRWLDDVKSERGPVFAVRRRPLGWINERCAMCFRGVAACRFFFRFIISTHFLAAAPLDCVELVESGKKIVPVDHCEQQSIN